MRSANGFSSLLRSGSGRRTATCGRCGDSFSGRAVEARGWLEAHLAAEHQTRRPVLRGALGTATA